MNPQVTEGMCRICLASGSHRLHVATNSENRTDYPYFQCWRCGCLQILDIPAGPEDHYADDYYSFRTPEALGETKRLRRRLAYQYVPLVSKFVLRALKNEKHRSLARLRPAWNAEILDVGCGAGDFLLELEAIGFTHLTGIDPFLNAATPRTGALRLQRSAIQDVSGCASFDIVMLHHSLEHMPDQKMVFKQIARILRPGGTALIRIPLSSSYAWEEYGSSWVQLDAPRHFYLHTYESLDLLANDARLIVTGKYCDSGPFQFTGSEKIRRRLIGVDDHQVFSRDELREFKRRAAELNSTFRGDQAVFYLKRRD